MREMVDLDLEEDSSSMQTSYEDVQAKPYLLSNLHTTFREEELDIGTINDESEDNFEESKDGEANLPTRKSTLTSDGGATAPVRRSTRKGTL